MSEFDDLLEGGDDVDPHPGPGHTGQAPKRREPPIVLTPEDDPQLAPALESLGLVTAASLVDGPPDEPAELGFEPDDRYLGFAIVPRHLWPLEPRHEHFTERFYVETVEGTLGLVPWPGSKIVWPWERAWQQDLHRTEVQSFLKDEKKKGK